VWSERQKVFLINKFLEVLGIKIGTSLEALMLKCTIKERLLFITRLLVDCKCLGIIFIADTGAGDLW
jgi:hypothetical protein